MNIEVWKKTLKYVSIVCIVVYAVFAALGIAIAASLISPSDVIDGLGITGILPGNEANVFTTISGIVIAVVYIVQLLCAVAILRGVKDPSKIKLGMILYGILSVFQVYGVIAALTSGGDISTSIGQCIVTLSVLWGSIVIYRSGK